MSGAGLVSRCAAALVDVGVLAAANALIGIVLGGIRYTLQGPPYALPSLPGWAFGVSNWVLVVLYLTASWTLTGRTPGQLVLGLRVVTETGRPPGAVRALVRALVCVAFPVGVLWTLVSRDTRAVHDLVAGTTLGYDPAVRGAAR
ncbi:RDD family protein [Jiangella anatolica]|uniref:RDD family protein n=1 Tax=Jiangella anatolica TaxID=2670374 RepID=A0A2W2B3V9_9ACTN|nr:RDD family protein [Jiangella anatolica]PZF79640.1 RDD family protein [Jiangella anatolica]